MFTYKAEELRNENCSCWVVNYTEFVARTLDLLCFEKYDNLRVWAVSRDACRLSRDLNVEPTLGIIENVTEAQLIIKVVGNIHFDTLPER